MTTFILFLTFVAIVIASYKKRNPKTNNLHVGLFVVICLVIYFGLSSTIESNKYQNSINEAQTSLNSSDYTNAYNKISTLKLKDEDKHLCDQISFLYGVNQKFCVKILQLKKYYNIYYNMIFLE